MKFWMPVKYEPLAEMIDFSRTVEELGFEGVTVAEHVVIKDGDHTPHPNGYQLEIDEPFLDPFCIFSALAAATTRLKYLTFVYVVPLRSPFHLAKQVASLAVISDNRFVLGTGVGWLREEFETVGVDWTTRGRRTDEILHILQSFLQDGYAEFRGEFYDFPRSGMFPVPTEPVPIWIGGHSTAAATRAARFDGYLPMDGWHERTRKEFAVIDSYRAAHGLGGPYERMVVMTVDEIDWNPDVLRRIHEEDGITGVFVAGLATMTHTHQQKLDRVRRFADEVIVKVA